LHPLLESGELNLTVVAMVSKYMKAENVDEIIARIKGRSKRAVERIIAEYEPKSALPADRVRMMVVPVKHTAAIPVAPLTTAPPVAAVPAPPATAWPTMRTLSVTAASPIVNAPHVPDQSPAVIAASPQFTVTGDSEKSPNCDITESPAHETVTQPEENAPATAGTITQFERLARVEFTAHEELLSGLEKVRSIASHRLPANAPLEQLIAFMVEYFLDREEPARREDRRETRAAKEGAKIPAELVMRKHIPAQVRDRVLVRDKQCTYVGANGKRCGSTHVLQIDHIKPVARGGASTIDNLRVLCAYHNRLESERLMGKRGPRVELRE
jgi:5-methylcytosine-specific restriction endonuclease McrA